MLIFAEKELSLSALNLQQSINVSNLLDNDPQTCQTVEVNGQILTLNVTKQKANQTFYFRVFMHGYNCNQTIITYQKETSDAECRKYKRCNQLSAHASYNNGYCHYYCPHTDSLEMIYQLHIYEPIQLCEVSYIVW